MIRREKRDVILRGVGDMAFRGSLLDCHVTALGIFSLKVDYVRVLRLNKV
jgi:hypothetical protein